MLVSEFEDRVYKIEGIRIIIRAPADTPVGSYLYEHNERVYDHRSLDEWITRRIRPHIGSLEIVVLDGIEPHRFEKSTTLGKIRELDSYQLAT